MKIISKNKKSFHEFEFEKSYVSGIVLEGAEVKSVKSGSAKIEGGYVIIRKGEAFLIGMHIAPYFFSQKPHDPIRTRKLLLKKREIEKIFGEISERGRVCIPTKVFLERGCVKIEISIGRKMKKWDKREKEKKKSAKKEILREIKQEWR